MDSGLVEHITKGNACQLIGFQYPGVQDGDELPEIGQEIALAGYLTRKLPGCLSREHIDGFSSGVLFRLQDNSMQPHYSQHEILVCQKLESFDAMPYPNIGILEIKGQFFIKQLDYSDGNFYANSPDYSHKMHRMQAKQIEALYRIFGPLTPALLHMEAMHSANP